MKTLQFFVLSVFVVSCSLTSVSSQLQQQSPVSPQGSQHNVHQANHPPNLSNPPSNQEPMLMGTQLDVVDPATTNHYPYQSTQLSPSNYHQPYSGAPSNYGRDVYGTGTRNDGGWGWYPYFGVNAGTAWELSAYFGPIFWCFVAIFATFGVAVGVSRFVMGGDIFGGIFQRIKDSAPSGKSLDLDNITSMVYQALETYGKFAAKDAKQGITPSVKG